MFISPKISNKKKKLIDLGLLINAFIKLYLEIENYAWKKNCHTLLVFAAKYRFLLTASFW